jgi:hypothetical protein
MVKRYKILYLTVTYIIAILALIGAYFFSKKFNIPFEQMTADPMMTFDAHPFVGVISNIGILFWCITASVCLFSGFFLRNIGLNKEGLFLISNGVITSLLLLDDFFMLHEYIFHSYQTIIYLIYFIGLLWYCLRFVKMIVTTNFIFLGFAFFLLGSSVFTDVLFENKGMQFLIEDSFKFLGITTWMLYFTTTSFNMINTKVINKLP